MLWEVYEYSVKQKHRQSALNSQTTMALLGRGRHRSTARPRLRSNFGSNLFASGYASNGAICMGWKPEISLKRALVVRIKGWTEGPTREGGRRENVARALRDPTAREPDRGGGGHEAGE
jgi:hypothetical protein